jgi:hypothetical protein
METINYKNSAAHNVSKSMMHGFNYPATKSGFSAKNDFNRSPSNKNLNFRHPIRVNSPEDSSKATELPQAMIGVRSPEFSNHLIMPQLRMSEDKFREEI